MPIAIPVGRRPVLGCPSPLVSAFLLLVLLGSLGGLYSSSAFQLGPPLKVSQAELLRRLEGPILRSRVLFRGVVYIVYSLLIIFLIRYHIPC